MLRFSLKRSELDLISKILIISRTVPIMMVLSVVVVVWWGVLRSQHEEHSCVTHVIPNIMSKKCTCYRMRLVKQFQGFRNFRRQSFTCMKFSKDSSPPRKHSNSAIFEMISPMFSSTPPEPGTSTSPVAVGSSSVRFGDAPRSSEHFVVFVNLRSLSRPKVEHGPGIPEYAPFLLPALGFCKRNVIVG